MRFPQDMHIPSQRAGGTGGQNAASAPCLRALSASFLLLPLLLGGRHAFAGQAQHSGSPHGVAVCERTDTYGCYTNHKYGYVIAWPKTLLTARGESAAGDGQIFTAPDGQAELRCWAGFQSVDRQSLQALFHRAQQEPGFQVTYTHLGKNFFVVSGKKDAKIVYQKTITGRDITATFVLTYAPSRSAVFNPIVGDIAKSFVASPDFRPQ